MAFSRGSIGMSPAQALMPASYLSFTVVINNPRALPLLIVSPHSTGDPSAWNVDP